MIAKSYLQCRMDQFVFDEIWGLGERVADVKLSSNLMAPSEMKYLGFREEDEVKPASSDGGATTDKVRDNGKKTT